MKNRLKNLTRNGQGIEREKGEEIVSKIVGISLSQGSSLRQNLAFFAPCNALL